MEYRKDNFTISADKSRLDLDVIYNFLKDAYWCKNIPRPVVEKAVENSLCYGVYDGEKQVGHARLITDFATFAYLADVFILEAYRGRGLSKWLMECVRSHPELQALRRWVLLTRDAHGLYQQYGFTEIPNPKWYMEVWNPDVYAVKGEK